MIATEIRTVTHFFCFKDNFIFLEIMANDSNKSKTDFVSPPPYFFRVRCTKQTTKHYAKNKKNNNKHRDKNTEENQKTHANLKSIAISAKQHQTKQDNQHIFRKLEMVWKN